MFESSVVELNWYRIEWARKILAWEKESQPLVVRSSTFRHYLVPGMLDDSYFEGHSASGKHKQTKEVSTPLHSCISPIKHHKLVMKFPSLFWLSLFDQDPAWQNEENRLRWPSLKLQRFCCQKTSRNMHAKSCWWIISNWLNLLGFIQFQACCIASQI